LSDFLSDRKASLENAFFAEQDARLRRQMAQREETTAKKAALAEASGISDDATLDRLLALSIDAAGLTALSLVP